MRGKKKVDADFNLLAAAHNLARLATLACEAAPPADGRSHEPTCNGPMTNRCLLLCSPPSGMPSQTDNIG